MRKLAVSLSKGGTGKTTTAVNLSAGLARAGQTVLLVDCDTQGQAGRALGLQPTAGLAEVLTGALQPAQAIVQARERLWLLAGGRELAGAKRSIDRREFGGERALSEALEPVAGQYGYVILDTGPGWDVLTVCSLFYVQEVMAPVSVEVLALQGLAQFIGNLKAIQRYHQGLQLRYILPTFLDRRVRKSEEILAQLQAHYGELLCQPIRYNVRLSEAPGHGQSVFEYSPGCPGAEDYQALTERVLHDEA